MSSPDVLRRCGVFPPDFTLESGEWAESGRGVTFRVGLKGPDPYRRCRGMGVGEVEERKHG